MRGADATVGLIAVEAQIVENVPAVRTVLVVDDDEPTLAAYRRAIALAEIRVLTASTVGAAHRLATKHQPDLCIVDYQLGCDSGIEFIREQRRRDPFAQLVLVTAYGDMEVGAEAARAGANHVLAKPVTAAEIMNRIKGGARAVQQEETASADRALWEHCQRVLKDCRGIRSEAARRLKIDRGTLQRWLDRPAPK